MEWLLTYTAIVAGLLTVMLIEEIIAIIKLRIQVRTLFKEFDESKLSNYLTDIERQIKEQINGE